MTGPLGDDAPLLAAYLDRLDSGDAPFTIPGHKRRTARLDEGLGRCVDGDVPLFGGLDEIKLTRGTLAGAERRAADLWGADVARFSVGGSTHANQAALLAVARPGERVVVTRAAHRSTLLGLVLAGLEPVWVAPRIDGASGVPLGVDAETVAEALHRHPDACAVVEVAPGYLGTLSDVAGIAAVAHAAGVPLLVDQAWGAHLGFHPGFPPHGLQAGADLVVTSVHKMLPGYSAAALLLARTDRIDAARLDAAFEATHTTSPAGAPLASIDGVRALLERDGPELLSRLARLVAVARDELRRVPGVTVPGPDSFGPNGFDPARLIVLTGGCGADGVAVERDLIAAGVPVELADRDTVVPVVTVADDEAAVARLLTGLTDSLRRHAGPPRPLVPALGWVTRPETVTSPRTAFFAAWEEVPAEVAVGRVAAELVAPYPPGVPVLAPGERITREAIAGLRALAADGVRVAYAADPTLDRFRVLTDPV